MINQGRYIINACLILFAIGLTILFLVKITNTKKQPVNTIINIHSDTTASKIALRGKTLFMSHCASCHSIFKEMTGPALKGLEERGPWKDRKNLYEWISNPPRFMANNDYAKKLKQKFGVIMTSFSLSKDEVDAIVEYINQQSEPNTIAFND